MRTLRELDAVSPQTWTVEEQLFHLTDTFNDAARQSPDILEPYIILLADAGTDADRMSIMRRGLRETVKDRYRLTAATALGHEADKLAAQEANQ